MQRTTPKPLIKYKNQQLMDDYNNMMIRIKRHLFKIPGDTIMPENKELDDLTNRIMKILSKDTEILQKFNETKI